MFFVTDLETFPCLLTLLQLWKMLVTGSVSATSPSLINLNAFKSTVLPPF